MKRPRAIADQNIWTPHLPGWIPQTTLYDTQDAPPLLYLGSHERKNIISLALQVGEKKFGTAMFHICYDKSPSTT